MSSKSSITPKTNNASSFKYILLWNRLPGVMAFRLRQYGWDALLHHGCDISNCYVVNGLNRSSELNRSIDSYDAVIFNSNALYDSKVLPWTVNSFSRSLKQRFVYFTIESPIYTWGNSRKVNKTEVQLYANFYNWSMTYRNDADIRMPYGSFKPKRNSSSDVMTIKSTIKKNIIASRSNRTIVAWMSSHCRTHSRRENYIRELKSHIAVDTYGGCGDLKCPKKKRNAVST